MIAVIVGGQFGGEGKGKVTAYLSKRYKFDVVVRCGGPNSGHTVTYNGKQIVLRQVPAGIVNTNAKLFLSAGCLINKNILLKEIESYGLVPERLKIDSNAVIIRENYIEEEKRISLDKRISSTCSGVGVAVAKRVLRSPDVRLAKDIPELKNYITNVANEIHNLNKKGKKILIEGTQGFGLSLYHSPYYPYTTSRDTTASAFLSEVGISPRLVDYVIMVIRTYPIRVGGNSGPLPNEISWDVIRKRSGYPEEIKEFTSVTGKLRRVGEFDIELVKQAAMINRPDFIALMGVDYIDYRNKGVTEYDKLTPKALSFIEGLEEELQIPVALIGTGPKNDEIIDRLPKDELEIFDTTLERYTPVLEKE